MIMFIGGILGAAGQVTSAISAVKGAIGGGKKKKKKKRGARRRAPLETKRTELPTPRIRSPGRRRLFGRRKPLEPR
ncbi:MAG: hypothetical protein GY906_30150 [bacterium]|nr:hypothetical protein [bacterium]